jgi:hypothetical protein
LGEEASGPFSWSHIEQADRKTQARNRSPLAGELFVNVESVPQGARAALLNCRYQAIAQACAVYSPFCRDDECNGDFSPIGVMVVAFAVLRSRLMRKARLGELSLVLVLATALVAVAQETAAHVERGRPEGWVHAPSSKDAPDLWQCARYGGSWVVSKDRDAIAIKELNIEKQKAVPVPRQLKLSKEMIGRRTILQTADGWLLGFDAGEFGGGLWWFSKDGSEGEETSSAKRSLDL